MIERDHRCDKGQQDCKGNFSTQGETSDMISLRSSGFRQTSRRTLRVRQVDELGYSVRKGIMPKTETELILASASPRRSELLALLGRPFRVQPSAIDESLLPDEAPADYIMRLSRAKVATVAAMQGAGFIVGADTVVVIGGEILGKPLDDGDARKMLRRLAGRWHAVMTGVAIYDCQTGGEAAGFDETKVKFSELTEAEIEWYLSTKEPRDKAGAYAIQGKGGLFIEEIRGNYHNVVGLPLPLLVRLARQLGMQWI